jgi:hypothetical protein
MTFVNPFKPKQTKSEEKENEKEKEKEKPEEDGDYDYDEYGRLKYDKIKAKPNEPLSGGTTNIGSIRRIIENKNKIKYNGVGINPSR